MQPAIMAGANFIVQSGGWLEGGLTIGYEKFVMDAYCCGAINLLLAGLALDANDFAPEAYLEAGVGNNFLSVDHSLRKFRADNYHAELADNNSFEQWVESGSQGTQQRAHQRWKKMLREYQMPEIDVATDEALLDFMQRRKSTMKDRWY
jgi:trimethylamine--corrinoid protein Co-methyltransferase